MQAILIEERSDAADGRLAQIDESRLPPGDVTIDVQYSSINYKDALAITGSAPVVRQFPMVAGIDLAGTVIESDDERFSPGDEVVATGHGLGERHWGGLAEMARVEGDWLLPLPESLSASQAMAVGTAGLTAMLCVLALERHGIDPGDVLVTGGSGGVGSVATAVLSKLGHSVVVCTGRSRDREYFESLGAAAVVDRAELSEPGKALSKERWAAAVDTVGGQTLANICASLRYGAAVAACGNAGGMPLPATVAPFILRAVSLIGIDSVHASRQRRVEAWRRLGEDLDAGLLPEVSREIGLTEVPDAARDVLDGKVRGRLVVNTKG